MCTRLHYSIPGERGGGHSVLLQRDWVSWDTPLSGQFVRCARQKRKGLTLTRRWDTALDDAGKREREIQKDRTENKIQPDTVTWPPIHSTLLGSTRCGFSVFVCSTPSTHQRVVRDSSAVCGVRPWMRPRDGRRVGQHQQENHVLPSVSSTRNTRHSERPERQP